MPLYDGFDRTRVSGVRLTIGWHEVERFRQVHGIRGFSSLPDQQVDIDGFRIYEQLFMSQHCLEALSPPNPGEQVCQSPVWSEPFAGVHDGDSKACGRGPAPSRKARISLPSPEQQSLTERMNQSSANRS